ncbi:MAG: hypothetical protein ACR2PQ_10140 [Myxococcota bacterium]
MSVFRSISMVSVTVALGSLLALASLAEDAATPDIGGRYHVTGITVDKATNMEREISGTITIVQEGATFTSHSEFKTLTPGSEIVPAKVLGTGKGVIEGMKLSGTGENQLQSSSVPGLDVDFGMIPHQKVSQRIQSSWTADVLADGTIKLVSDNTAGEGEEGYSPTRTTLEGKRVPAGAGS